MWLHLRPPDTDYFFHKKDLRFFFGEVGVCITKGISFIWRPLILRFIYCYFFAGIKDKSFWRSVVTGFTTKSNSVGSPVSAKVFVIHEAVRLCPISARRNSIDFTLKRTTSV